MFLDGILRMHEMRCMAAFASIPSLVYGTIHRLAAGLGAYAGSDSALGSLQIACNGAIT